MGKLLASTELLSFVVNLAISVCLVCGLGLSAVRLGRRAAAPLRHGILLGTLGLVLLSPAAVWLAQRSGLALVRLDLARPSDEGKLVTAAAAMPAGTATAPGWQAADGRSMSQSRQEAPERSGRSSELPAAGPSFTPDDLMPAAIVDTSVAASRPGANGWQLAGSVAAWLWGMGAAVGLLRLGWGCWVVARYCRELVPLRDVRRAWARQAAAAVGLQEAPAVFLSRRIGVPMSVGLRRPVIVVPEAMAATMDAPQWQAVLLHEMTHIARGDLWVGFGERIAAALFWWNPLVHRVCGEIAELREEICDNSVVAVQGQGERLARLLVELAAGAAAAAPLPASLGVLETGLRGLRGRVARLMDSGRTRETRMSGRAKLLVASCALAIFAATATIGGLRVSAVEKSAAGQAGSGAQAEKPAAARPGDRFEFRGRVVDPQGKPFAGAKIYLLRSRIEIEDEQSRFPPLRVRAVSGPDGGFEFSVAQAEFVTPPAFECVVAALADGYGPGLGEAEAFDRSGNLRRISEEMYGPHREGRNWQAILRLAKDDVPLTGRVVDEHGRAVRGARARVLRITTQKGEDLSAWLEAVTKRKANFFDALNYDAEEISTGEFAAYASPAVAGADGTFRIAGIGRERIAELLIEGPGIASCKAFARTRPGATMVLSGMPGERKKESYTYYGASFEHTATPSIPVVGSVTDKDTGKPLPGAMVCYRYPEFEFPPYLENHVRTSSDAQGHFRLAGVPVGKDRLLLAMPSLDQPYLCSLKKTVIPRDKDSLRVDFVLKRGVWIRGRITDAETGEPLLCGIRYYAFRDNPNCKLAPGFQVAWLENRYQSDGQGRYAIPGLPGRGIVAVHGDVYVWHHHPPSQGAERIAGAKVSKVAGGATGTMLYDTYPSFCIPESETALAEVRPAEGAASVEQDFRIVPGRMLTGTVLDPDGKPLAGTHCSGFDESNNGFFWQSETARFQINAYRPDHPRRMFFVHLRRKLAGSLTVAGAPAGPISVRLQPWGVITGRVVDKQGKPIVGLQVARRQSKVLRDPQEGYVPAFLHEKQPDGTYRLLNIFFPTGPDGRFRIEGLAPGVKYNPWVWDTQGKLLGELIASVSVASGETKDLGDLQLKPLKE